VKLLHDTLRALLAREQDLGNHKRLRLGQDDALDGAAGRAQRAVNVGGRGALGKVLGYHDDGAGEAADHEALGGRRGGGDGPGSVLRRWRRRRGGCVLLWCAGALLRAVVELGPDESLRDLGGTVCLSGVAGGAGVGVGDARGEGAGLGGGPADAVEVDGPVLDVGKGTCAVAGLLEGWGVVLWLRARLAWGSRRGLSAGMVGANLFDAGAARERTTTACRGGLLHWGARATVLVEDAGGEGFVLLAVAVWGKSVSFIFVIASFCELRTLVNDLFKIHGHLVGAATSSFGHGGRWIGGDSVMVEVGRCEGSAGLKSNSKFKAKFGRSGWRMEFCGGEIGVMV